MALKFRRGTTAQQSGSLVFGEPYVNTTLGTLIVGGQNGDIVLSTSGTGSTGNFGAISGSGLDITGNANIGGNLNLGGQLTIGDNTSDTVNVVASLSSSLIPQTTNAFDLGSVDKIWRDLYISTGSIKVVANGAVVSTLSTNADGSQNFPNGLNISGSLIVTGSISTTADRINIGPGIGSPATYFQVGRVGGVNMETNTLLGFNAITSSDASLSNDTAIGYNALKSITQATSNTAVGANAGTNLVNGNYNTLIGVSAGHWLSEQEFAVIPTDNTYMGASAGRNHRTGSQNAAFGAYALYGNVSTKDSNKFDNNTAIGRAAGNKINGVSSNNIYIGASAGPTTYTEESYKFYVGNGDSDQQPYMFGNMTNASRSLDINAGLKISGSLVVSGSTFFKQKVRIGNNIGNSLNSQFDNALEIGSNPDINAGGAIFLGNNIGTSTWAILSDTTNDFQIANNNSFNTRAIILSNTDNKVTFLYSGSLADEGAGFHNIRFDENGIIPYAANQYDLGSETNYFRDLYISTGSIKVVANGAVVSTLSTNADGSQNFPNGLSVTGSLKVSGSVKIGEAGYIKDTLGSIHMYTSGANYNNGGQIQFGGISGSAATGVDNYISFNGAPTTAASNTSVTIWGDNSGGGAALFLNRKSSQGVESWGYTPWTIGVDLGATSTPNGLYIGTGNTFLNRSIEFNYKGLTPNILFSGSGIIPAEANIYDLGTPTKPWREIYVSTGSINFVNNGTVVSTLSTNPDGSQNFPKGLNISGSLIVTGSITATGDVVAYSTSDKRHKNNIVVISDALSKVTKLNGVTWEWNDDVDVITKETPKTGLIAQEVQEVLPEVVKEREDGFLALDYSKMMGLMVEAIKEQQEQINSLLTKINELENK
jgi:hypothetical protein